MPEVDALEQGRSAYAAQAWTAAHAALGLADRATPLEADDLELLATAAYMLGRDDEHVRVLERAHHTHLEAGAGLRAIRCAFWIGINLMLRGEMSPATGWLGRAQRLLESQPDDCVEQGYLLMPLAVQRVEMGESEAGYEIAGRMVELAERHRDADLLALALHEQGHALLKLGRLEEGLGMFDEAMVAVIASELSPIVTGLVYCSVIEGCHEVFALRRADEWTGALSQWCERQPDLVAFSGRCRVHRAEIMQLRGAWADALAEARRAGGRGVNEPATAEACYRQGELYRLRGEFAAGEQAYREASRFGREPQPGLALLRLAQGNIGAAAASIRRVMGEAAESLPRARLLPAYVEIMLAAGDVAAARDACALLAETAAIYEGSVLSAMVAQARGAVALAEDDPSGALAALREAWNVWVELDAPYEAARVRALLGLACRAVGDEDSAALELDAARAVFAELGAVTDVARLDALDAGDPAVARHGLTARELEVLRLVAAGRSNRDIAAELVISEHTVARHVQNIFLKLGVSSRTAASAFAFSHELV